METWKKLVAGGILSVVIFSAGRMSTKFAYSGEEGSENKAAESTSQPRSHLLASPSSDQLLRDWQEAQDPLNQRSSFLELLASMTAETAPDIGEALIARGFGTMSNYREFTLFLQYWGAIAGKDALNFVLSHEDLKNRGDFESFLTPITNGWDPSDIESLLTEALSLKNEKFRDRIQHDLITRLLFNENNNEATKWIARIDPSLQVFYTKKLVYRKVVEGLDESLTWASSLQSPVMKETALERVAAVYYQKNSSDAATWAGALAPTEENQQAVARVAEEWAENAPREAADWVSNLPDGAPRNYSLGKVIREWSRRDHIEAGQWLNTLEKGTFRDQGVSQYVKDVFKREPSVSLEWAMSISDPELKQNLSELAFRKWIKDDRDAARQWAEASNHDWSQVLDSE